MNELQSILGTLEESVKRGLNAVLSPAECRTLLSTLKSPNLRHSNGAMDRIMRKMTDTLEDAAIKAIEDLRRR
jgi:hypothetical protein